MNNIDYLGFLSRVPSGRGTGKSLAACFVRFLAMAMVGAGCVVPASMVYAVDAPSMSPAGRRHWSTPEAWAWNERVGVIRGFNEFGRAYPGMSEAGVMRKARSLGCNSVHTGDYFRSLLKSSAETKRRLHHLLDEAQTSDLSIAPVLLWGSGPIPGGRPALQDTNAKVWRGIGGSTGKSDWSNPASIMAM